MAATFTVRSRTLLPVVWADNGKSSPRKSAFNISMRLYYSHSSKKAKRAAVGKLRTAHCNGAGAGTDAGTGNDSVKPKRWGTRV